jgi:Domain of unknown function (DUF305)
MRRAGKALRSSILGEGPLVPILSLALVILAGLALWLFFATRPPGDDSAEAGFARDMMVHHAQAVEMAEIVRDRTENPLIRSLATDIALTQQAQIGQTQGWLDVWGLSPTGTEKPMAWMGHPMDGPMPGMASREEIDRLGTLPPEKAEEAHDPPPRGGHTDGPGHRGPLRRAGGGPLRREGHGDTEGGGQEHAADAKGHGRPPGGG